MSFLKQKQVRRAYQIFKAIREKNRLTILREMHHKGQVTVRDLQIVCNKTDASITNHLRTLREVGLVRKWYDAVQNTYFYHIEYENFKRVISLTEIADDIWEQNLAQKQEK
jgi:DNA-binding transcriptional ArsR family regulator